MCMVPALEAPYETEPTARWRIIPAIEAMTTTDLRSDLRRRGIKAMVVK